MEKETREKINKMFPHFAGYDDIRLEMAQLIDLVQNHELYASKGVHNPRGWLLYGAPGTGKTRIVRDIAAYLNIPCIEISASDAVWKKISNEEEIRKGFDEAKKYDSVIVFIDEIEKLAGYSKYRYEITENLNTQKVLLHELDVAYENEGIIVIATCNHLDYLGEALSRSGRFDRQIQFNKPEFIDRKAILRHFLSKLDLDDGITLKELAKMTPGCSGSDLEAIVNEASIKSISERRKSISINDFSYAVNRIQLDDVPRIDNGDTQRRKITAYHEAGHAYMTYCLMRDRVGSVSILRQGDTNGVTKVLAEQEVEATSFTDLKNSCMIGLGGYIATKVLTGDYYCGNTSDLENVSDMVNRMLKEGFYGPKYIRIETHDYSYGPFSSQLLNDAQEKGASIIQELMDETERIIENGEDEVRALAKELINKSSLLSSEVVEIFDKVIQKKNEPPKVDILKLPIPTTFPAYKDVLNLCLKKSKAVHISDIQMYGNGMGFSPASKLFNHLVSEGILDKDGNILINKEIIKKRIEMID